MNDLIRQNFGFLIAYVLPGFVVVSGAAPAKPATIYQVVYAASLS